MRLSEQHELTTNRQVNSIEGRLSATQELLMQFLLSGISGKAGEWGGTSIPLVGPSSHAYLGTWNDVNDPNAILTHEHLALSWARQDSYLDRIWHRLGVAPPSSFI